MSAEPAEKKKKLRSGYTTGACAAAAAKAAVLLLAGSKPKSVEIPFPDGSRHRFVLHRGDRAENRATASVIKDAGDDPDVTNGAEIVATAASETKSDTGLKLVGGTGVGTVTKPGLPVTVGAPAINPVPEKMIREAVDEGLRESGTDMGLTITISVPNGVELAEKTLNRRLGIVGGLSILGTTGIVRPVSAEAWTATITASMKVARALGLNEVVLSTGRTSEKAVQEQLELPVEAFAMMGDYLKFSLEEANRCGFTTIHLAAMWAKICKAAMEIPQTHVRHGALESERTVDFLQSIGVDEEVVQQLRGCNTVREIYLRLVRLGRQEVVALVCERAKQYAEKISGLPVIVYLVSSEKEVVNRV